MNAGNKMINSLTSNGFKKVDWDKCPRGYERANYPCYSNEERNIWAEVYLGEKLPYMWIVGDGVKSKSHVGGQFIDSPKILDEVLNKVFNVQLP